MGRSLLQSSVGPRKPTQGAWWAAETLLLCSASVRWRTADTCELCSHTFGATQMLAKASPGSRSTPKVRGWCRSSSKHSWERAGGRKTNALKLWCCGRAAPITRAQMLPLVGVAHGSHGWHTSHIVPLGGHRTTANHTAQIQALTWGGMVQRNAIPALQLFNNSKLCSP